MRYDGISGGKMIDQSNYLHVAYAQQFSKGGRLEEAKF